VSEFTVEISRPGELGLSTSADLELPATQAEYHDAMEKARTTDYKATYSTELLDCERDWLCPHIPENVNLLELNLLAIRMDKYIKDEMDVFEGMVNIETKRNGGEPIPLPRLINLTFSTENCHVAGNITNDTQLGKFLYENDFLSDGDVRALQALNEAGRPVSDLLALLGKEHRANEGGTFTSSGRYVEFDGSVNEAYVPHEMAYFESSGAPVVLEISKGFFNDPDYDNDLTATLGLPATAGQVCAAVEAVKAASAGYFKEDSVWM